MLCALNLTLAISPSLCLLSLVIFYIPLSHEVSVSVPPRTSINITCLIRLDIFLLQNFILSRGSHEFARAHTSACKHILTSYTCYFTIRAHSGVNFTLSRNACAACCASGEAATSSHAASSESTSHTPSQASTRNWSLDCRSIRAKNGSALTCGCDVQASEKGGQRAVFEIHEAAQICTRTTRIQHTQTHAQTHRTHRGVPAENDRPMRARQRARR